MSLPPAPGFAPSAARGAALDAAVRARLAESLDAIADSAEDGIPCDRDAIRALGRAVAAHPVRSAVMVRYTEAVTAVTAEDLPATEAALAALADPALRAPPGPALRVMTLRDADLGPGGADAYRRVMDDDPETPLAVLPLEEPALRAASARVGDAIALLDDGFAEEIGAVAPEILAVRGRPGDRIQFDGATSFHLWGCFALNLGRPRHPIELATAIAHESGHAVLFGLTMGGPVVANPDGERYASPLREDARPMEGIAHATWVLARMHLAVSGMLGSGRLDATGRAIAAQSLQSIARDYAAGLSVMARHARLTEAGAAAFAPAEAYMASQGIGR
ncbi:aKG-HExxH-type peptide beta-hydroxylase [Falsiroseomonas sp. HW251]|uniref:aKG-HExxH-type peptide beta-hydroxylase n=1 Tax=Falsiroseomonas sp. HW251 TaxID=3390998 RepID=UPI003D316494